jgi:hypothetical protein
MRAIALSVAMIPFLAALGFGQGQSVSSSYGGAYYDLALETDNRTVDGYDVLDSGMSGPADCDHNYQLSFYFDNSSYQDVGRSDTTISQTNPASQFVTLRIDTSMVTDGTGTSVYYAEPAANGFCGCVSQTFLNTGWIPSGIKLPLVYVITTHDLGNGVCASLPNCYNTPTCCQQACTVIETDGGHCDPAHETRFLAVRYAGSTSYTCWPGISSLDPNYQHPHYCQ